METNVGDKKVKNIPKRIVGDVKSFIKGLAIGVVISIIGGLAYGQIWQEFLQSKLPWDVYIAESRTHLLVRNPSLEIISELFTEGEITQHLLLDIDGDNREELLIATISRREGQPAGKLLLYDSGDWKT